MKKKDESNDNIPSTAEELEALESRFSEVRGNETMEKLMEAAKEYIREKGNSND